jgi:outer membrane protein assembly factor BamA
LTSFLHERDSTERFFGFGNDTPEDDETNYTNDDTVAQVTPGLWVLPYVNVNYRMRIRRYGLDEGQVDTLPFTGDVRFRGRQPDLGTSVHWGHQLALVYDSRDDIDIPRHGAFAALYGEVADRRLGSTSSFVKFGAEWRKFIPFRNGNPVLALRALADYTSGSHDTPFWEMASLGGRRTLRGFGSDRFIDFNRSLATAEVRTRVWSLRIFGVNAEIELAPFVETGQVFSDVTESPVGDLHWVGGLGFRGVVRPQIVGFVDIGYGAEGSAIFTGVDYPF